MLESLLLKWPILKDLMLLLSLNPMLLDHGSLIQMHQIIFLVTLLYSLKQNKGSLYLIPVDSKGLLGNCFTFHCDISFLKSPCGSNSDAVSKELVCYKRIMNIHRLLGKHI